MHGISFDGKYDEIAFRRILRLRITLVMINETIDEETDLEHAFCSFLGTFAQFNIHLQAEKIIYSVDHNGR